MKTLDRTLRKAKDAEKAFRHKAVLFVPSESYDAATITVVQGLQELGFSIYVYRKSNINSWFCNQVLDSIPAWMRFDFVLSNLHWGTQWHLYRELNLYNYPKVLVDGCDHRGRYQAWLDKYEFYCQKYKGRIRPQGSVLSKDVQPYRWMEPLDGYVPDVVFTSQKDFKDKDTIYLPFGIHREYLKFFEGKVGDERDIDFAHIPGPGDVRKEMANFLKTAKFPGRVHDSEVHGTVEFPKPIQVLATADNNVHSYHRWGCDWAYFKLLNRTKMLLYPGVTRSRWDSKRPWEALANGCLLMTVSPPINMSEYPVTELCPPAVYSLLDEMAEKCRCFHFNPGWAEQHRLLAIEGARKYFTAIPIARYFLWQLKRRL